MSTNLRWAGSLDMYRKIPVDLMEGTKRGSILSLAASFVMLTLFLLETGPSSAKRKDDGRSDLAFFASPNCDSDSTSFQFTFSTLHILMLRLVTNLQLDSNDEPRVRLNFNITMMDLKCEYAVVDVVSVLGTEQNVSQHITKWHVDADGVRQRYQGRNKQQKDIDLFDNTVTRTLKELYEDGEDAVSLSEDNFECSHCRDLHPTWETLAELMTVVAENIVDAVENSYSDEEYKHAKTVELPVMVAKVDCVTHQDFCRKQQIMAYPTLRLFVDGERWPGGDYRGHRTVIDMADYLQQVEDSHKTEQQSAKSKNVELAHRAAKERLDGERERSDEEHEWADQVKRHRQRLHHSWVDADHPGCQLSGHLLLDRVPGNFHIQARSPFHDLVPHLTNVSHVIHTLSIGEPVVKKMVARGIERGHLMVPANLEEKLAPMDGNVYVTKDLHEAYHHYLKVVTTNVEGLKMGKRELKAYQIIQSSQLSYYRTDIVPEAKFIFDLSPIAVHYNGISRHWYDYITSIMAIIGGNVYCSWNA